MRRIALLLMLCPVAGGAEDWKIVKGDALFAVLVEHTIVYDNDARQNFSTSVRTLYAWGADSCGYWRVQNEQYCSMWPPSDLWARYDFATNGDPVRFTGETGDVTEGVYDRI